MTRSNATSAPPPTSALESPPDRPVIGGIEAAAIGISAIWFLVVVAIYVLGGDSQTPAQEHRPGRHRRSIRDMVRRCE